jgi:hypothetical protein
VKRVYAAPVSHQHNISVNISQHIWHLSRIPSALVLLLHHHGSSSSSSRHIGTSTSSLFSMEYRYPPPSAIEYTYLPPSSSQPPNTLFHRSSSQPPTTLFLSTTYHPLPVNQSPKILEYKEPPPSPPPPRRNSKHTSNLETVITEKVLLPLYC